MFTKEKLLRLLAFYIDFFITSIAYILFGALFLEIYKIIEDKIMFIIPEFVFEWIFFAFIFILFSILFILYSTIFLGRFGATIGKMVFGLKVVDKDKNQISYELAAKRTILLLLVWVWFFMSSKESPHDKILNLRVVKRSSLTRE